MPKPTRRKPKLTKRLSVDDFRSFYWLKADLTAFAVAHGIASTGKKLEVAKRIETFLKTGRAPKAMPKQPRPKSRDSAARISRKTPVVGWVCDAKTRAFFERELGPGFHFTVSLNRLGRTAKGLTYGDLVDSWRAEKERRKDRKYKPKLGKAGEYNQYVRDFFADSANEGKGLEAAVAGWNRVKKVRGPRKYSRRRGW